MNKFDVWINGRRAGTVWAADEDDACHRIAKRYGINVELVSAR